MTYNEKKEKLSYLLNMIKEERCISLNQVADKFNCSRSTVKRMITELRNEGHSIVFCNSIKKILLKK